MTHITGPLADALKRGRDTFNARFAVARHAGKVDGEAFLAHLAEVVDPIVRAVHGEFAEKVDAVTLELYDLSLSLFASSLLGPGAKSPAVAEAWRLLLPRAAKLLAREPARLAGSVTNAAHNLAAITADKPRLWTSAMIELAPLCSTVAAFLDCGKVVAWRCGMAQYRAGALATARQLDAKLAAGALGVTGAITAAALDRLAADPWLSPADAVANEMNAKRLSVRRTAGDFRGFSGAFIRPPLVAQADGGLIVSDGEYTWTLLADAFGTHMQRVDRPPGSGPPAGRASPGVTFDGSGIITWDKASARIDDLANIASLACDGHTLAVTIPTSHHVFLLARG